MSAFGKKLKWYAKTYIGVILAFLYIPVFVLIVFSFNDSKSKTNFTGFTLKWYGQLFRNQDIQRALMNTLIVALVSSVVAVVVGTAAAIGMNRMSKRMRKLLLNVTYLPLINPDIITGVSLMLLFTTTNGIFAWIGSKFGADLNFQFGYGTLILSHITFNLPYVILNVRPRLRQMDPNVFEAALDLGCTRRQAYFKVVIPDIAPGILAGFMTAITMSLDDFVISYFVSGSVSQTLPITIFSMTRRKVSPEINALSTLMFLTILVVLVFVNISDNRRERKQLRNLRERTRQTGGGSYV